MQPVGQQQLHPFQGAGPVRGHAGRVGERGEELAGDAQAGFLTAAPDDLAANRLLEASRAEASGAGQVAVVAVNDDAQRGDPGAGPERLPGGAQGGRPDALEQVADLLDLAADLGEQLLAVGTQVPQPGPGLIDRLRDVAAQLRGQPGDQHHVLLIFSERRNVWFMGIVV